MTRGFVPAPVQAGLAHLVKPLPPTTPAQFTIVLKPPHRDELASLARDVADPTSPRYRQFLTFEQWKSRYAPSDADVQALADWAAAQGFEEVHRFASNQSIVLRSDVATLQRSLGVTLGEYEHEGHHYYANDRQPSLAPEIAERVADIVGLESFVQARASGASGAPRDQPLPRVVSGPYLAVTKSHGDAAPRAAGPRLAPDFSAGFTVIEPPDLWSGQGYNFGKLSLFSSCCNPGNLSSGSPRETSIAIIGENSVQQSDLTPFFTRYGLAWNITQVAIDHPTCCEQEMTADVEFTVAMANSFGSSNNTAHVYMYEGGGTLMSDLLDAWQTTLSDNNTRVATSSYGLTEEQMGSSFLGIGTPSISDFTDITVSMAAMGWTMVAATGDRGATDDCGGLEIQYPGSDPNVLAVGGTSLAMSGSSAANLAYGSEVAWGGSGCGTVNGKLGGGGGGCSSTFTAPFWQSGLGTCINSHGFNRSTPDIALNSGNGQAYFFQGVWKVFNGTSQAAPEMGGFFAQANSYLVKLGLRGNICGSAHNAACAPIGVAAPALYYAGRNEAAQNPFYDITSGCNGGQNNISGYCAGSGYDQATGWGSANMLQLSWAINHFLNNVNAAPPVIAFNGPPLNTWFTTDQTLSFTIAPGTMGIAGYSAQWDIDPLGPTSHTTPGTGDAFWDGPAVPLGTNGSLSLAAATSGCHTAFVRAWDNDGKSTLAEYGPVCYSGRCAVTTASCGEETFSCAVNPNVSLATFETLQADGSWSSPVTIPLSGSTTEYLKSAGPFTVRFCEYTYSSFSCEPPVTFTPDLTGLQSGCAGVNGSKLCGTVSDGCGGTYSCGTCKPVTSCNGRAPVGKCSAGWRCCGDDGWSCGVCT